jgi:ribokinase
MNMDLVALCDRFPGRGETVIGKQFKTTAGGKGGNQAVSLALLEAEVYMIGCLGEDIYGKRYLTHLDNLGVECSSVEMFENQSTGIALIEVEPDGVNRILVVPGANRSVTPEYVKRHIGILSGCDYLMLQGEIPYETLLYGARLAKDYGMTTIFDPAPAGDFPPRLYPYIDFITPNKTETFLLTGIQPRDDRLRIAAADMLLEKGVSHVLLKWGAEGVYYADRERCYQVQTLHDVKAVDSTAAGDAFNAGLAYALGEDKSIEEALRFANVVAALSTERLGAQSAMPSLQEARTRLRDAHLSIREIAH